MCPILNIISSICIDSASLEKNFAVQLKYLGFITFESCTGHQIKLWSLECKKRDIRDGLKSLFGRSDQIKQISLAQCLNFGERSII